MLNLVMIFFYFVFFLLLKLFSNVNDINLEEPGKALCDILHKLFDWRILVQGGQALVFLQVIKIVFLCQHEVT